MGDAMSSLLFQPPRPTRLKESKLVWLDTKLGSRIPGFFLERSKGALTILYSHANAEDLGTVYPWIKFLSKSLDVNIFVYDYSGYGLSSQTNSIPGGECERPQPSEDNCYADIDAAFHYLTVERKINPSNIVLYGRSLGSGPSCYLASRLALEGKNIAGLVLHAPFLSVFRIIIESGCTLFGDQFPNIDRAPDIRCPVFVIHGTKDKIVPFSHGERLLFAVPRQFRAKPLFIEGMGHNHVHALVRPLFVQHFREFLNKHVYINCPGSVRISSQNTYGTTRSSHCTTDDMKQTYSRDTLEPNHTVPLY
uniref:AB hydrolase-1 domain-containing protein n=1 Tax=Proboscia inermis TaxID=420281 RepID=A0A7S0CCE0_9STRA|mmetsp:Transcript_4228/g.4645  ORF Transcript_4228/g.4645 Transcript_4228/m.4645 type:complete len:307 (-) Transcript_4228:149-1069(-)